MPANSSAFPYQRIVIGRSVTGVPRTYRLCRRERKLRDVVAALLRHWGRVA
ncbi:MAG TPA: hypothetical protein VFA49_08465 [Chloroflexota bacterium]|jgi:hypothetical protein|nr:hypothetical protein [Chloroflexota bacterium]